MMKKIVPLPIQIFIIFLLYAGILSLTYKYISRGIPRPDKQSMFWKRVTMAGLQDAEHDIAQGRLVIVNDRSQPPFIASIYAGLLKQRYGIICLTPAAYHSFEERAYWAAYQYRTECEILKRYGMAILDDAAAEAESLFVKGSDEYREPNQPEKMNLWAARDKPYTITIDLLPPLPEEYFSRVATGDIEMEMDIRKSGEISHVTINRFQFLGGPYEERYSWSKSLRGVKDDHHDQDSVKRLLQPWIDRCLASIHARINSGSFFWQYRDSLHVSYTLAIGPHYADDWVVRRHIPPLTIPKSVLGRGRSYEVALVFWVDRWGKIVQWKIGYIKWDVPRKSADGETSYVRYLCGAKSILDTTRVYMFDRMLLRQFGPWIKSIVPKITFEMNQKNQYFNYFDIARLYVMLPQELPNYHTEVRGRQE